MSLLTNIQSLATAIGNTVKPLLWIPPEPSLPVDGKSYAPFYNNGAWVGFAELPDAAPAVDEFVVGWSQYPFRLIEDLLASGTNVAAVSLGSQTPTVGGIAFEQSSGDGADSNIPDNATGWTGTNWQLLRVAQSPFPVAGSTNGRTETTPFADFPDPSNGVISGADVLCATSMRRDFYLEFSGLTIGNNYSACLVFATYPNSLTTATFITPQDGGNDTVSFGVDGVNTILNFAIKRYSFTATATTIGFTKICPDNSGSYINAAWINEV